MSKLRSAILVIAALLPAGSVLAQSRTFESPLHDGLPVAYCGAAANACGEAMAMAWCETQGFETAIEWAARSGIDAASRSIRLDDGGVCEGASCESFAAITCRGAETMTLPRLGAAAKSTVLAPGERATEVALRQDDLELLMPGCVQRVSGVFVCDSVIEYEHCRTLMISRMVFSCRIEAPFAGEPFVANAAAAGEYELSVESNAEVRIDRRSRGFGQIKGRAEVELRFPGATDARPSGNACSARVPRLYWMTGPYGGTSESGKPGPCEEAIRFDFEPHRDDLMRAYDLCDAFAAWGDGLEDSIEVLAAGLYEFGAAGGADGSRAGGTTFAPFVRVEAPLTVVCRD